MPNYFIGIDGGGTKTNLVITDEKLNILTEQSSTGSNPLSHSLDTASKIIKNLIEDTLSSINIKYSEIKGVTIGAAGAGREVHALELRNKLLAGLGIKKFMKNNFIVTSDVDISLKGAFPDTEGIILIAGTGSIIYGRKSDGKIIRAGGFGNIIGDEGSGYSIGRRGLSFVSKVIDGREHSNLLFNLFQNKYKINDIDKFISAIYDSKINIAEFAECVIDAAANGDETSKIILMEECGELISLVKSMINSMESSNLKLSFGGSLLLKSNYYSDMVKQTIKKLFPNAILCRPKYSPEIGAVLISIENYRLNGY